jgi:hypothetical protein
VKVHPVFIWAVLLLLPLSCLQAQIAPELREEGVLYFEDNLPNKIIAKVKAPVTVYLRRDFGMAAAYLGTGQQIELLGMSPEGYLVKGDYRGNTVTGWIRPEDLPSGIDPALFEEAKKNQAWHDTVAVAIANKNVIAGMTPDEVTEAVGKPDQTTSRTDANGTQLTWVFTTYREEPQNTYTLDPFGRAALQVYYVKVPIGQMVVNFVNGAVIAVEQHSTDPSGPGVVTK